MSDEKKPESKNRRFKVMSMRGEWGSLEDARLAVEAFFKKSKVPPLAGQRAWVQEVTSRGSLVGQTLLSVDPCGNATVVDALPFKNVPAVGSEHFHTLLSVARKIDAGLLAQGLAELKVVLRNIDYSIEQEVER